jgi:hypothetical protein|tara:strand:- start:1440 stop:2384 length:945 start_codon:yes stop_codon:yes gene_type:complete
MKINELKIVSAKDLNESLAKTFGTKLRLEDFTNEQLEDARNKLRTQLSQVETNESFDTVHKSDAYQKGRMFLDVINQEIAERTKIAEKAKPDFLDIDKDGDKKEPMKKAADEKGDDKKDDSKGLSAKQKKLPAGLQKAIAKKNEDVVKEGAEESATLVMAAKDMVDRVTGWMEDTAEMQTESMLELGDKIRDEMGSEQSEQFINTVKPALENLYTVFETTREALSGGVAIVTGEGAPEPIGADPEAPAEDPEAEMEPTVDADAGAEEPVADEFGASEPATGGEEVADREKRESVERSRRLGQLLTDSKKKAPVK